MPRKSDWSDWSPEALAMMDLAVLCGNLAELLEKASVNFDRVAVGMHRREKKGARHG